MIKTEKILNALVDSILVINQDGKIEFANTIAQQIFSRKNDTLIGLIFGFPVVTDSFIDVNTKSGILNMQMKVSEIYWNNTNAFLVSLRDLTDLVSLENQLKEAFEHLEKSYFDLQSANEELKKFNYSISHDLKAPLRAISGYANIINESITETDSDIKTFTNKIISSAERMNKLIDDLLALASLKIDESSFTETDLNMVVKFVIEDLNIEIKKNQARLNIDRLPTIKCNPNLIKQVFQNLISNSIKFRKNDEFPQIDISCSIVAKNGFEYYEIKVSDNGIGFSNDYSEEIFDVFKQLNGSSYKGSGIGLSLVKKIVKLHKGNIRAFGKPGKGSIFSIELPKESRQLYEISST